MKIATVTVGQSPRSDVVPEFQRILGSQIEILERGALDGLTLAEVERLSPLPGRNLLITRMRDGTEVKVDKEMVEGRVQQCIDDLQSEPVELVVLICTGEFPGIRSEKIILRPYKIIEQVILSLVEEGKLGILLPSPEQIPLMKTRWNHLNLSITMDSVSPYTGSTSDLEEKAKKFRQEAVDLTLLDCIGFSRDTKKIFAEITGKPVLLPMALLARITRGILGF